MSPSRIDRTAAALLERCGITHPAVQVEKIASCLGVRIATEPLDEDVSGMLYRQGGRSLIMVNAVHAPVRRRFSIAHELGHFVLHNDDVFIDKIVRVNFRDSRSALGIDPKEIQANYFAAALLMPEEWIFAAVNHLRAGKRNIPDEKLIEKLARQFDVSQEALRHRLANIGILGTF